MNEGRESLEGDMNMETGNTFGEEGADAGALVDRDVRLGQSDVSASPALLERCE